MVVTVQKTLDIIEQIAKFSLAENWDNVGLIVGSPHAEVTHIMLALDPCLALLKQATAQKANLLITHHPAIFRPLHSIRTDDPGGTFIAGALQAGINVIGCHTNLDSAAGGINDALALSLGIHDTQALVPHTGNPHDTTCGLGRIGRFPQPITVNDLVTRLQRATSPPYILEAGPRPEIITRAAVCGGSCSDLARLAQQKGADVFITSELKHDVARWAEDAGFWLIDGGHFATENLGLPFLQQHLLSGLADLQSQVPVTLAKQHPPLRLLAGAKC